MRKVIIESPYSGDVEKNLEYLRMCLKDSLVRGEAPFASHGLYTQEGVLNDKYPEDRMRGIKAGLEWYEENVTCLVYADLGISKGMREGIRHARDMGVDIEVRFILGGKVPLELILT